MRALYFLDKIMKNETVLYFLIGANQCPKEEREENDQLGSQIEQEKVWYPIDTTIKVNGMNKTDKREKVWSLVHIIE